MLGPSRDFIPLVSPITREVWNFNTLPERIASPPEMHPLSLHLEQKLHAIFMSSNINCGQRQRVLIYEHDTINSVGAIIRTSIIKLFFFMHQCDQWSSDIITGQSIAGWTYGSMQWLQWSHWCSLQQLVNDQVYENRMSIFFFFCYIISVPDRHIVIM